NYLPGLAVTPDGFIALLANGARNRVAVYHGNGLTTSKPQPLEGEHVKNIYGLSVSQDGKHFVYTSSTASTPLQWYHATLTSTTPPLSSPEPITPPNEHAANKPLAKTEVVRWKGARDEEVEGILYYPHGHEKGKKYALVVMIHGGPAGADFDSWEESWAYAANLFCQRGAFVLKPNYHGSSNYGLKWLESI